MCWQHLATLIHHNGQSDINHPAGISIKITNLNQCARDLSATLFSSSRHHHTKTTNTLSKVFTTIFIFIILSAIASFVLSSIRSTSAALRRHLSRMPKVTSNSAASTQYAATSYFDNVLVDDASRKHEATVIVLHGMHGTAESSRYMFAGFRRVPELQHVRWVYPTAPMTRVDMLRSTIRAWFNVKAVSIDALEDTEGLARSSGAVHALIEKEMQEHGIKSERILLCGVSQGGALALHSTLSYQKQLGGALVVYGFLPAPTYWLKEAAKVLPGMGSMHKQPSSTNIRFLHGEKDSIVPYQFAQLSEKFVKFALRRPNTQMRSFTELDHYTTNDELREDIANFLIQKLRLPKESDMTESEKLENIHHAMPNVEDSMGAGINSGGGARESKS